MGLVFVSCLCFALFAAGLYRCGLVGFGCCVLTLWFYCGFVTCGGLGFKRL